MPKPEINRRAEEAAALLELTELLDRKPALLSGGRRQPVAMGPAIARQPAAYLMNEPLSNRYDRPEAFARSPSTEVGRPTVEVIVELIEALGAELVVHTAIDASAAEIGDPDRAEFDATTGATLRGAR